MFFVPLGGGSQSDDSSVLTGKADLELFAGVTMVSPTFRKISNAINYFFSSFWVLVMALPSPLLLAE